MQNSDWLKTYPME